MKKTILAIIAAAFCVTLSAQQTIKSEPVNPFTSVSFSGNVSVELIKADKPAVDVNLYDADIKYLKWGVTDGQLSVSLRPLQTKKGIAEVKVYYADELKGISISKGDLTIKDSLSTLMASISVSGGAKLVGKIDATDIQLDVTGNSVAMLNGKTIYLTVHATERSKVDTRQLSAISVDAETAMGAEASVDAQERLVANAKTGSTIFYKGNPAVIWDRSSKFSTTVGSSVLKID